MYNKLAVFKKELAKVENLTIRKFAEKVISNIPDYFLKLLQARQESIIRHTHWVMVGL